MNPLSEAAARRARMIELGFLAHSKPPGRYRAIAEWWRLSAKESAIPEEYLAYAEGQDRLAVDMELRPGHYARKPSNHTDFQWSKQPNTGE